MLYYALLPWGHRQWQWFFRQLDIVVLDEVHAYRGIFGSHVALVCRRLARLCERFDSDPQFICCSATIGNPIEHASAITGQAEPTFTLVDDDMSATGPTHWLWNLPLKEEAATETDAAPRELAEGATDADETGNESALTTIESSETVSDGGMVTPLADATPATAGGDRRSNHPETVNLFCDLVTEGYQTLVFTRARQGAERYAE